MRPRSYIGVTGIMSSVQGKSLVSVLPEDSDVDLMLGLLMSSKTIRDEPNKWPKRYPKVADLGDIFFYHPKALNLIHFNTKSPENLYEDMLLAQSLAGTYCHGFQLNLVWPDPTVLEMYKWNAPFTYRKIVLQCGHNAMRQASFDPGKIAERVREYKDLVDYVLIDPSGGLGRDFDQFHAERCFDEISDLVPDVGLGIAGGLHEANVERQLTYLFQHHNFSIDAEGRLRDANDDLNIVAAQKYIVAAERMHRQYRVKK